MSRRLLIGSYFSQEYALESAALFNPSMVLHPDQTGLPEGWMLSSSGSGPEGKVPTILLLARSRICTVSSSLAQMSSDLPSLVSMMPRGRWPTGTVSLTSSVAPSITEIELLFSFET